MSLPLHFLTAETTFFSYSVTLGSYVVMSHLLLVGGGESRRERGRVRREEEGTEGRGTVLFRRHRTHAGSKGSTAGVAQHSVLRS